MVMGGSTRGRHPFYPSEIQCWANATAAESNQSLNPEGNPQAHRQPDEGLAKVLTDDPAKISAFTIGEDKLKLFFLHPQGNLSATDQPQEHPCGAEGEGGQEGEQRAQAALYCP